MRTVSSLRSRIIVRQRLLDALQRWPELRLIRIVASAGFGKSSLAAAWAQSLADLPDDARPAVAWLPLTANIDAARYVHSLIDALRRSLPGLQSLLILANSGERSPTQSMQALCAELATAPHPVVLVIDDFHLLTDPTLHALTQQILDDAGDRLHLVLLSRTTPPIRISHLVLDDAVLTLTERDLAFDHAEFSAFARLVGLDAQPTAVLDELAQRGSGWITGLKLISYDLLHRSPADSRGGFARLDSLTAENGVQQFLESRILAQLPTDLRDFALAAASLPWMSAALMSAVTDAPVALCAHRIADLAAAVGFISEFESAGELRFHFHPLVHDALRRIALSHHTPPAWRIRAAVWLCDHDLVDEALTVLDLILYSDSPLLPVVGGQQSAVDPIDSLARATRRALLRFDLTSVQRWLDALPPPWLAAHAPLALDAAWHAFLSESVPLLDTAIPRALAALQHVPTDPMHQELHLETAVLATYHRLLHGHKNEAMQRLAAAEELARSMNSSENSLGRGYLNLMHCLLLQHSDDIDACTHSLQKSADIFERMGFEYGVIHMMFIKAAFKHYFNDLQGMLADSLFLQGFAELHSRGRHAPVRENMRETGETLYILNDIAAVRRIMQNLLATSSRDDVHCTENYIACVFLALCDAAEAADPRAALAAIDPLEDAAQWARVLELESEANRGYVAWPRILRDHCAGRYEHCWQTVESLRLSLDDISDQMHYTLRLAILGGAVLSRRNHPNLAEHLDSFLVALEAIQSRYMAQHVRLLRVLHAQQLADDSLALDRLHEMLPITERSGAVRLLLDFPELLPLLQRCNTPFAARIAQSFPSSLPQPTHDAALTPQEIRILQMIAAGCTTKDIAAAQTLSPKTIYSHMHNIFQKLGVHSRKEAVRVWRGEEIVDSG
jgi:ATP/maltotriose-dependent transcriptional regulator MalT